MRKLDSLATALGRRRTSRLVQRGVDVAWALIRGFEGTASQDFERNGERLVLQQMGSALRTVFDVGANVGEWTSAALSAGAGHVHAFEISPSTSATLEAAHGGDPRVTVNRVGLGDAEGSVTIRHFPGHPVLTTTTAFPHDAPSVELEVPVRRGDGYMGEHGVEVIDLLKIDVEGAEPAVLRGFEDALGSGRIGAVQFEYGMVAIYNKFNVIDYYELLGDAGFLVGPLTPSGVAFQGYDFGLETFRYCNFLAVHRARTDLLGRLQR